jgi:lauroyl/myristoyl acyltransferase
MRQGEWIVLAYDQHGERFEEADYFASDKEDAQTTAKLMVNPPQSPNNN